MSKATNVKATLIEDELKYEHAKEIPGSFFYYRTDGFGLGAGMIISCPCGCKKLVSLNFDPEQANRPCWKMSGSQEVPTLTPSVGIYPWDGETDVESDGYHWHGWLRGGMWISV